MKIKSLCPRGLAVVWLLGLLSACSWQDADVLSLHSGHEVRLRDYRGKWLLINYWAIWCAPCRAEMPELNRLHQADDIELMAVNFDRQQGLMLEQQARQLGIDFPLLLTDPLPLFDQQMPTGLPATLVIGPDGKFHQWLVGPQTEAGVRKVLAGL